MTMTRIDQAARVAANLQADPTLCGTSHAALGTALELAASGATSRSARSASAQSAGDTSVAARAQSSAATELGAAFAGSPESFLARIAFELRRSNSAVKEAGIAVETSAADTAERSREAADAAAAKAAEQATGFLGLGKTFDLVAKIASAVTAVAATVITGGAAAPVAVGLLLMTFGGDLASVAVKMGLCSESLRGELTTALKLTGAIMIAACSLGAGVAAIGSVTLEATSEDVVSFAAEAFGMSDEARGALRVTLALGATVLGAVAGGAAGAGQGLADGATRAVLATARDAGRLVATGAQVASAATAAGAAVSNHDAAYHRIDSQEAATARDASFDLAEGHVDGLRSALRAYGRAMKLARQAQEARGQALRAATQQRA
jgi:hypothetical protein